MKIIGLTGGIASGKSTVSSILKDLGAEIIDADILARRVVEPGNKAYNEIVKNFGKEVLTDQGLIDRKIMAAKVFKNSSALQQLNGIIHPQVIKETQDLIIKAKDQGTKVVVVDAPLLIEANMTYLVDEVWVVAISPEEQIKRAVARDKATREEISARIANQMPLQEKVRHATRVIDNSGPVQETLRQVKQFYAELISE